MSGAFTVVPGVMGLVFSLIGLVVFMYGVSMLGVEGVFEFGDLELVWQKGKHGRSPKKKRYTRESFSTVKKLNSGQVNNDHRFKVLLKGGQSVTLCSCVSRGTADELEQWLQNDEVGSYGASMEI